jgi:hypothetical protein
MREVRLDEYGEAHVALRHGPDTGSVVIKRLKRKLGVRRLFVVFLRWLSLVPFWVGLNRSSSVTSFTL